MNTEIVSREELKALVSEVLESPKVKNGDLFIAGVTKVKEHNGEHQMMLEIVQSKNLRGGKPSVLQLLNAGDDRFKANSRSVRVWLKITKKGFDNVFAPMKDKLTGQELHELTKELQPKQVLAVFTRVLAIEVEGEEVRPTIAVRQYSAEHGLPERIKKILAVASEERSDAQVADLDSLAKMTKEGEALVDHYGNQVYEINELTFGEDENVLIPMLTESAYIEASKKAKSVATADKKGLLSELVD